MAARWRNSVQRSARACAKEAWHSRAAPRRAEVAGRVAGNIVSIFGKDIGAIVVPVLYRGAAESGQEVVSIGASRILMAGSMGNAPGTYAVSFGLSAIALVGFVAAARRRVTAAEVLVPISVVMIALVPSWSFRYTLDADTVHPVLPARGGRRVPEPCSPGRVGTECR